MKKIRVAFGIVLAAFLLAFAAALWISFSMETPEGTDGIARAFGLVFTIISLFACVPGAAGIAVAAVCMFAVKKKKGTAIALLVLLLLFSPAFAFALMMEGSLAAPASLLLLIFVILAGVLYLGAIVLSVCYLRCCVREGKQ